MPQRASQSTSIHQQLRPRRTRVKTGCMPCRLRRKKCDELKPICSGCSRNHLICYPPSDTRSHNTTTYNESQFNSVPSTEITSHEPSPVMLGMATPKSNRPSPEVAKNATSALIGQLCLSDVPGSLTSRHPTSHILLEHYIFKTADLLSINRGLGNAFIACVIPLAFADSMVMDSVLALSGAHLCYTTQEARMKLTSLMHYTLAIRQLKYELTRVYSGEPSDPVRILLTILLLSTAESVSGNSEGAIFHHLRASSQFIPQILAIDPNCGDTEVRAFLLETYAYMVSVANITVNIQPAYSVFALGPCIAGLERFQSCQASGMMFGFARDLITLIPSICTLGYNRIIEEDTGMDSLESAACYADLLWKLENWKESPISEASKSNVNDLLLAAKLYKEAILIFLHAAFYASKVTDPEFLRLVDTSLYAALSSIDFDNDSPVLPVMLWPSMIMGSCLRDPMQREYLRCKMLQTTFNMTVVLNSVQLLDWLWEDNSIDAYGPYGLGSVMKKHGIIHSMS